MMVKEKSVAFSQMFSMSEKEFNQLRQLIYDHCGIEIRPHKKQLLINRLAKRLRNLGLSTFSDYLKYLNQKGINNTELIELIDAITTNKTDFFRESKHFTFMEEHAIPETIHTPGRIKKNFRVWSSACSSGEEPYSIMISLNEAFSKYPGWKYEITASDISETILRQAVSAIYEEDKIAPIPKTLLRKYFLRGNDRYKVKPEHTHAITFHKINLKHDFHRKLSNYDIVFCRNVLIYFNKETQSEIIQKIWHTLNPGGYLFLGHSETLHGMDTSFQYVMPSVYRRA